MLNVAADIADQLLRAPEPPDRRDDGCSVEDLLPEVQPLRVRPGHLVQEVLRLRVAQTVADGIEMNDLLHIVAVKAPQQAYPPHEVLGLLHGQAEGEADADCGLLFDPFVFRVPFSDISGQGNLLLLEPGFDECHLTVNILSVSRISVPYEEGIQGLVEIPEHAHHFGQRRAVVDVVLRVDVPGSVFKGFRVCIHGGLAFYVCSYQDSVARFPLYFLARECTRFWRKISRKQNHPFAASRNRMIFRIILFNLED